MALKELVRAGVKTAIAAAIAFAAAHGIVVDDATATALGSAGTGVVIAVLNAISLALVTKFPGAAGIIEAVWPAPAYPGKEEEGPLDAPPADGDLG